MYNKNQVMTGIKKFVDNDILKKVNGWQKWILGTGLGVAISRWETIYNSLKDNTIVKALELINDDDMIDVDTLYNEMIKQARMGSIHVEIPMLGVMTLSEEDVMNLYNYIING